MAAYFVHGPPLYFVSKYKSSDHLLRIKVPRSQNIFFLLLETNTPIITNHKDEKLQMSATFIRLDIQQMTMPNNNGYTDTHKKSR